MSKKKTNIADFKTPEDPETNVQPEATSQAYLILAVKSQHARIMKVKGETVKKVSVNARSLKDALEQFHKANRHYKVVTVNGKVHPEEHLGSHD